MFEADFRFGKLRYWRNPNIQFGLHAQVSRNASLSTHYGGSIRIGERTSILAGALLWTYGGVIEIGNDCSVNPYSIIHGGGGVSIGNDVRIAPHCMIVSENHVFEDRSTPIRSQGLRRSGVSISNDVWLGSGVRVLDGVTIAEGCVIAAGAVVNKSTEPYGIYGGVPARKIGVRGATEDAGAIATGRAMNP